MNAPQTARSPSLTATVDASNRSLSKSKLIAFRQCPRRMWLEIHHKNLCEDSASALAAFATGHRVGDIAQRLFDPEQVGVTIDVNSEGFTEALRRSAELLRGSRPIFEAGFFEGGGLAFADVMLPIEGATSDDRSWRMVEVKSAASFKPYHRDDAAIQAYLATRAGVRLSGVSVACVDSSWTYPGGGEYRGLLKETDVTAEAMERASEVETWIAAARAVAMAPDEPAVATGDHCSSPYACGFHAHCASEDPQARHPVGWLPGVRRRALKEHLAQPGIVEMVDVPDELLNEVQLRVKTATVTGTVWFDAAGAAAALVDHRPPFYFLDFETIQFVVPIWAGTRPNQQLPFQFSLHCIGEDHSFEHREFIDLSSDDPSVRFIEALIAACGDSGPVFVYNATFENARMRTLGIRFPAYEQRLSEIVARVVDLLPVARDHYYHPDQQGSWSIKKVLPAVLPALRYDALDGVQDGGAAMTAYLEAIDPATSAERRDEIRRQLLAYCHLDTYAMVRLWQVFAQRDDLVL